MKILSKFICSTLSLTMIASSLSNMHILAAENSTIEKENVVYSDTNTDEAKTNLVFIEGKAGESHVVYTYNQKGKSYKVVEDSSDDFKNVISQTYVLDENGNYVKDFVQTLSIDNNGIASITTETIGEGSISYTMDLSQCLQIKEAPSTRSEWRTYYRDGVVDRLKNLAISVIVGILTNVLTAGASTAAQLTISGLTTVATDLALNGGDKLYYHEIHNWRESPKNYLVIDETIATNYYYNSAHTAFAGYSYAEYIF